MPKVLKTRKTKIKKRRKKNKNFIFLRIIIIFVFFGIGIFNLLQINHKATSIYEIDNLKSKIEKLKDKKETMGLEASKLQSLANVYERLNSIEMESVGKIKYLKQKKEMAMAK